MSGVSQVVTKTAAGTQPRWLGALGHVGALTYGWINPGGANQMSCTLQVPPDVRTDALNPGRIVQVFRGGQCVWDGKLQEPVPSAAGWQISAVGVGNQGTDFVAKWTSAWGTNRNDAVDQAITRGLRWVRPSSAIPAGVWFGQIVDSGAQTITDLLNLFCTKGGYTWYVTTGPAAGVNTLSVYTLPANTLANVTGLLVSADPVSRTLGGDINSLFLRYNVALDAPGTSATFALANVTTAASITQHQALEAYEDLSSTGVQTLGAVQSAGNNVLNRYQRASFGGPFTVRRGQLLTTGGYPVDLGMDQCGLVVRLILADYGYGGEVVPDPVIFMVGQYDYDDTAQTAQVTPFQSLDLSFSGMLSLLGTTLRPHPVYQPPYRGWGSIPPLPVKHPKKHHPRPRRHYGW